MAPRTPRTPRHAPRKLYAYRGKRDFDMTPEPLGDAHEAASGPRFVVQKHAATRLHFDLRLELGGVLLSWAVPKGPSLDPAIRRLAVQVEDHPLEYADFEGVIPAGEYGGGTVMVWDRGRWRPTGDPRKQFREGRLTFVLFGEKLKGGWSLIRTSADGDPDGRNWLLIKLSDEHARPGETANGGVSALSGRTMDEIAEAAPRTWRSGKRRRTGHARRTDVSGLPGAKRAPLPRSFRPELATPSSHVPEGERWLQEVKFDGYRLLAFIDGRSVRLMTRNGNDWTERLRPIARALGRLATRRALLDGELVSLTAGGVSSFQALQNALRDPDAATRLVYFLFDAPHLDGHDLTQAPLIERKRQLRALLEASPASPMLRFSDHVLGGGEDFLRFACRSALEGIVCKKADSPYRQERTRDWIKVKCLNRQEFVIGGFTEPAGGRVGFGALLLGFHEDGGALRYCGRVGTGFSTDLLRRLAGILKRRETSKSPFINPPRAQGLHWTDPKLVAEVEFSEWTQDGILRHPSFLGLREDKRPGDVKRERMPSVAAAARPPVAGVRLTHPDKVLYPELGITKRMLADYYGQVADRILPHLVGRPLMIVRCPEGVGGECFFQKHPANTLPRDVRKVDVVEKAGTRAYLTIERAEGLIGLVQMGTLEIHPWGSANEDLERPDRMILDLDPDEGVAWADVVRAASRLHDVLQSLGLSSFVRTTGGEGLHVVVPLDPSAGWEEIKAASAAVAREMVGAWPDEYVATMSRKARRGKIFIDHFRNHRGSTAIASYSTRARPEATVATPLAWSELTADVHPGRFTVVTLPRRLAMLRDDPWKDFLSVRQTLSRAALQTLKVAT